MAVTVGQFLLRYPEFCPAPQELIEACLEEAELLVDRTVYGAKADMAIKARAAHFVAINPLGELARLDKKGEKTTYLTHFEGIKRGIGAGCRVI